MLITTWNDGGNIPPIMSLARGLKKAGHEVYVATHDALQSQIEGDGLSFVPFEKGYVTNPDDRTTPFEQRGRKAMEGVVFGEAYYEETQRLVAEINPDVLLPDGMMSYSVKAALDSGLPTVSLWHTQYSILAEGSMRELMDQGIDALNAKGRQTSFPDFQALIEAGSVLVFTYSLFDNPIAHSERVHFVGPLRDEATPHSKPSDRPLILVSQSSMHQGQLENLQKICRALDELSVDAIVTTGRGYSPDQISAPDHVQIVPSVVHDEVIPSVDLLVHHGGCGTTMAGIMYGKPMLCIPGVGEQEDNGRRIASFGNGRLLSRDASVETIRETIRELLVDEEVKAKAAELYAHVQAHPGIEEAVRIVETASAA